MSSCHRNISAGPCIPTTPLIELSFDSAMSQNDQPFVPLKRYPEPMAHGLEACEPSHPLWPMVQRPVSRHTRAEAVDTGYLCSLTREIWNLISNQ